MTVHARGYRKYEGGFGRGFAPWTIAKEGFRLAFSRKSFKRIGILYLMWFSMCTFFLYVVMGTDIGEFLKEFERMLEKADAVPQSLALAVLDQVLRAFYAGVGFLTALLSIFVGAGLISEDLGTGALPLYLVRPLRPWEYVLGKALVLPVLLFVAVFLPGILFYVIVSVWQRPGESWPFFVGNLDVVGTIATTYVIAAASYSGLMLFLSSRTTRRPAVAVLAGVAIFAGVLLASLPRATAVDSKLAGVLQVLDLPRNVLTPFLWRVRVYEKEVNWEPLASTGTLIAVALGLLALGLVAAWRRARSVEVVA